MRCKPFVTMSFLGLLAAVVVSCGGDGGSTPTTVEPATSAPAVTSSTTLTPAVIQYQSGATYLTGWVEGFTIDEGTLTIDDDGVQHTRDGTISYRLVSEDPRAAGIVTATWNTDRWGTDINNGAMIQWGTSTLTNDDGSWEAPWAGAFASPYGDILTRWWRGSGDYEGLTFLMWVDGSEVGSSYFEWKGIIYPGDPPPVASP